ncbi:MAG: hypothetical protein ABEI53_02355 [Candidatus Magasanikbacteria bacterium]
MRCRFFAVDDRVEPVFSVLSEMGFPTSMKNDFREVPSSGILIFTNEDLDGQSYSRGGTFFHRASHHFDGLAEEVTPFLVRFKPEAYKRLSDGQEFREAVSRMANSFDQLLQQDLAKAQPPWFSGHRNYISILGGQNPQKTKADFQEWLSRAENNFPEPKAPILDALSSRCDVQGKGSNLDEVGKVVTVLCPVLPDSDFCLDIKKIERLGHTLEFLNKASDSRLVIEASVPTAKMAESNLLKPLIDPGRWSDPELKKGLKKGAKFLTEKVVPALEKRSGALFVVEPLHKAVNKNLLVKGYEEFQSPKAKATVNKFISELKGEGETKFHLYSEDKLREYALRSLSLYYADYMRFSKSKEKVVLLSMEAGRLGWNSAWNYLRNLQEPAGFEIFWLPRNCRQSFSV